MFESREEFTHPFRRWPERSAFALTHKRPRAQVKYQSWADIGTVSPGQR